MLIQVARNKEALDFRNVLPPIAILSAPLVVPTFSLTVLFLSFLKIGAVMYGSGYVLLTFLRAEFVERLAWLTDQQLLDAVAIGQVTPGPLFTTATFIGYVLGGLPGGLLATLGIFLPSFIFVLVSAPWIPRLRSSPLAAAFLDGVNISALGLMAAVTWQLGAASFVNVYTVVIGVIAGVLLFRFRVNSFWLVLGGGVAGLLGSLV
jgi:chromate transporter